MVLQDMHINCVHMLRLLLHNSDHDMHSLRAVIFIPCNTVGSFRCAKSNCFLRVHVDLY